jgi:hypothetical protein
MELEGSSETGYYFQNRLVPDSLIVCSSKQGWAKTIASVAG